MAHLAHISSVVAIQLSKSSLTDTDVLKGPAGLRNSDPWLGESCNGVDIALQTAWIPGSVCSFLDEWSFCTGRRGGPVLPPVVPVLCIAERASMPLVWNTKKVRSSSAESEIKCLPSRRQRLHACPCEDAQLGDVRRSQRSCHGVSARCGPSASNVDELTLRSWHLL